MLRTEEGRELVEDILALKRSEVHMAGAEQIIST
jgi:hypothetical protein